MDINIYIYKYKYIHIYIYIIEISIPSIYLEHGWRPAGGFRKDSSGADLLQSRASWDRRGSTCSVEPLFGKYKSIHILG